MARLAPNDGTNLLRQEYRAVWFATRCNAESIGSQYAAVLHHNELPREHKRAGPALLDRPNDELVHARYSTGGRIAVAILWTLG